MRWKTSGLIMSGGMTGTNGVVGTFNPASLMTTESRASFVRMPKASWCRAFCRSARSPLMYVKRAPATSEPVSLSMRPSASPSSTWSFGLKSNFVGSPTVRTTTLPDSSGPTGVSSDVCSSDLDSKAWSVVSASASSASSSFIFSFSSRISSTALVLASLSVSLAMRSPATFCAARNSWIWPMSLRRCSSAYRSLSMSTSDRLAAAPFFTRSGCSRMRLMSIIGSGQGGHGFEMRQEVLDREAAMIDGEVFFRRQVAVELADGVEPEQALERVARRDLVGPRVLLLDDLAFGRARGRHDVPVRRRERQDDFEARAAFRHRDAAHPVEDGEEKLQVRDVLAEPAVGAHAGRAAQDVDLKARVVGQGRET